MQHDSPTVVRPLRADAARNRDRLLAAAAEVFGESGSDASLEEIARRAEVGVGTLYRHFPTRAVLIEQVYRRSVDEICESGRRILAERPPLDALREWLQGFVEYVGRKRGMVAALKAALGPESAPIFAEVHTRMEETARLLLGAAQSEGTVRTDVEPMDVMRAVSGVCLVAAESRDADRARRIIGLVVDGLRYGAASEPSAP
jgi:AcrR family transcriptional regulator